MYRMLYIKIIYMFILFFTIFYFVVDLNTVLLVNVWNAMNFFSSKYLFLNSTLY